jgi:hypothetical protein
MLNAKELLRLLDEALEQAKNPEKKKAILKDIFQPLRYGFESELDQDQALDRDTATAIIQKFVALTTDETKSS